MFPKGRKQMAVLTLVGLLGVSIPAAGAGRGALPKQTATVANRPEAFFSWAWRWVRSIWEKNGACIDPDGREAGPHIDPNGRCIQSGAGSTPSQPDNGPHIDPDG
ncbi:MAG TPA: hypothetical protein VF173_17125 [Thermoanaerobaculia bacterium]|nr:hypothetical protein [Thermoanaerobaculia bacterium]